MHTKKKKESCFLGDPMGPLTTLEKQAHFKEAEDRAVKIRRADGTVARGKGGELLFHGAFTGGFSAGYFNTVGSKEGWTSSATFVSRRRDKKGATPGFQAHTFQHYEGQEVGDEEDQEDAAAGQPHLVEDQYFAGKSFDWGQFAGHSANIEGFRQVEALTLNFRKFLRSPLQRPMDPGQLGALSQTCRLGAPAPAPKPRRPSLSLREVPPDFAVHWNIKRPFIPLKPGEQPQKPPPPVSQSRLQELANVFGQTNFKMSGQINIQKEKQGDREFETLVEASLPEELPPWRLEDPESEAQETPEAPLSSREVFRIPVTNGVANLLKVSYRPEHLPKYQMSLEERLENFLYGSQKIQRMEVASIGPCVAHLTRLFAGE